MLDAAVMEKKPFVYDKFLVRDEAGKIIGMTNVYLDRAAMLFEHLGIEITVVYSRIGSPVVYFDNGDRNYGVLIQDADALTVHVPSRPAPKTDDMIDQYRVIRGSF